MDKEITCLALWGRNGISLVKQAPYRNCPPREQLLIEARLANSQLSTGDKKQVVGILANSQLTAGVIT
jgi:hypothetical protein